MTIGKSIWFSLPLLAVLLVSVGTFGQTKSVKFSVVPQERFPISELKWREIFGARKGEPNNVYTLMTQGSILAPRSTDYEKLTSDWLDSHASAEVVLVYTITPMMTDIPDSKMKSVWIVDGDENLNLYLVAKGACPAGTMVLELGDETPLSKDEYEAFEKKAWEAENKARADKLGIWAKK